MSDKISIRFFNDREVRAAWDSANSQWLFSVVDVIAILTESKNPRNYWKVMKHRLAKDGNELVTKCNQLKMAAADGKRILQIASRKQTYFLSLMSPQAEMQWRLRNG